MATVKLSKESKKLKEFIEGLEPESREKYERILLDNKKKGWNPFNMFRSSFVSVSMTSGFIIPKGLAIFLYVLYSFALVVLFIGFNTVRHRSCIPIDPSSGRIWMAEYKPSCLALHDVSLMNVKVDKGCVHNISSGGVFVDFGRLTDFSLLTIEPDRVTQTGIYYTSKIKLDQIEEEGLSFLARFPELQSLQNTRVMLVTILLSLVIQGIFVRIKEKAEEM